MVSQPKSGQRKSPEQWEGNETGSAVAGEVPTNQQTCKMETSHPTDGGEEGSRSSQSDAEEKNFVASLYTFMKDRGTPIERIPHLGFKQINLWRIYKAVEKLGGYDSVTARRLWKNVYDELGGSPGSTSAATCTRRHYERLVLPFERQLRGEEDKPLPPAKPRKQYKKSPEGKSGKAEGKRKRSPQEGEGEADAEGQEKSGEGSRCPGLAERSQADCCGQEGEGTTAKDQPASNCTVTQPVKSLFSSVLSSGGEVISPLEKKKRMAQASLSLSQACPSPEQDSRGRPSVIHCAQSPGLPHSGRTRESSEGSPVPHSSSSSRSPSPCSVSSDDCLALPEDCAPVPGPEKLGPPNANLRHNRDMRQVSFFPTDHAGVKTPEWGPGCRGENRHSSVKTHLLSSSASADMGPKACWVPPMSSFTKVLPKSGELLRPVSYQPGHKVHQNLKRPSPEEVSTYGKKLQMVPPLHHGESKERSKLGLPKPIPSQHSLYHPHASFPISYLLPAYERTRPVSSHQLKGLSLPPLLFPAHLTQPSPVYRHVTSGTPYSVPYESFPRPRPYQIPIWHPQAGYAIAGLNPHYPNTKL